MQIFRIFGICFGTLAAAVGFECDEFLVQHINDLIKTGTNIYRYGERHHLVTKILPQTGQRGIETHMLLVETVHCHEMRHAEFARPFPDLGGPHFHAIGGIHGHQCRIAHTQGTQSLGQEIEIARCVYEIQLLVGMLHTKRGGVDGYLPFLFGVVIVTHRRAGLDAAQPVDGARRRFHTFGQHRLA